MTFMDSFNEILDIKIFGIPVIIIFAVFIFIIWFVWQYKPKSGHKRLDLEKEIRKDFDSLHGIFYSPVKKNIVYGFQKIGYAFSYFPMFWDKTTDWKTQLKGMARGRERSQLKMRILKESKNNENIVEMSIFKCCKPNIISKGLGLLGLGYFYMVVPSDNVSLVGKDISVSMGVAKDHFLGITYLSKAGRGYIENIAYKISRKEELTELADFIPKMDYLEKTTAEAVVKAREKAKIEKDKYKGQIEGSEEL